MNILKTPAEYALTLSQCYPMERWSEAAFDAAQNHRHVPASYFASVHMELMAMQELAQPAVHRMMKDMGWDYHRAALEWVADPKQRF
jgi:hypothetical protein